MKPKKSRKKGKSKKVTAAPLPMIEEEKIDEDDELGLWNKALALAGLDPYEISYEKGVAFPTAISYYIDACNLLPSSYAELKRFAAAADFGLSRPSTEHGSKIAADLLFVAELRTTQGLAMVGEISNTKAKPSFDLSKLPAGLPKPAPGWNFWANNPDKEIDALCEYLDTLAPRHEQAATRGDYERQQHAGRSSTWPSASTLGRVGEKSISKWIARAEPEWQQRLAAKKAA